MPQLAPHKLVLDALAEAGQHRAGNGDPDERGDGQHGDHLEGGGAGEPRTERHVAPQAQAEAGDLVAFASEDGNHTERVVAPVLAGLGGRSGCLEGLLFSVILGVDDDFAVGARRDAGQGGKVDGHGHHKALGIIGVFADQVNAARRNKNGRNRLEAGKVERAQSGWIMHGGSHPSSANS